MDGNWRPLVWLPSRLQLSTTIYTPFDHWSRHGFWLKLPDASDRAIPGRLDHEDTTLADVVGRLYVDANAGQRQRHQSRARPSQARRTGPLTSQALA
jgi:hypothetical protein